MWDRLLVDCNIATMDPAVETPFGAIENGAIGIADGRIVRVGRRTELAGYQAQKVKPLHGAWVTPGLVDCHTHLVFAGDRAGEFEQRLDGASYAAIAAAGGGIAATVKATRAASLDELVEESRPRLRALAPDYEALSADHLEHADEEGVAAMARAGMVAVLLPGAFYALQETRKPPVDLLRRYGVPMAVATDCNPGTSPVLSPTLMMSMACTLFGLTPEEALAGMTRAGAQALGLAEEVGTISAGKAADLCIWRIGRPAELCYWIGMAGPERRIVAGEDA